MQWEYFSHDLDLGGAFVFTGAFSQNELTRILNHYGEQQWELVSTFTTHNHGGSSHIGLVFKRPKPPAVAAPPVASR